MAGVDFSDREAAEKWLEEQSVEMRCAIASRAALRVVANISAVEENARHSLALAVLRSILTSSGRGMASTSYAKRVNWRDRTKASAEAAAFTRMKTNFAEVSDILADSYQNPTKTAVYTPEHSAIRVAGLAVSVALAALSTSANSTAKATAQSTNAVAVAISVGGESIDAIQAVRATAHAAVSWDSTQKSKNLYHHPVWVGAEVPDAIEENHQSFLMFLRSDSAWSFWLRFYEGMWEGTFDDWDLAFEVIQIEEADWEKGYEHIGEVIAGIEARRATEAAELSIGDVRQYEPSSVTQLFAESLQIQATLRTTTTALAQNVDLFDRIARPNEVIAFLAPIRAMPDTIDEISALLQSSKTDLETEIALKQEIGRLLALVARLETELRAAKANIEDLKSKPWFNTARLALGGTAISAIVCAAWAVSGDELGPQQRLANLQAYWTFIFGENDVPENPLRLEVPDTWEI